MVELVRMIKRAILSCSMLEKAINLAVAEGKSTTRTRSRVGNATMAVTAMVID